MLLSLRCQALTQLWFSPTLWISVSSTFPKQFINFLRELFIVGITKWDLVHDWMIQTWYKSSLLSKAHWTHQDIIQADIGFHCRVSLTYLRRQITMMRIGMTRGYTEGSPETLLRYLNFNVPYCPALLQCAPVSLVFVEHCYSNVDVNGSKPQNKIRLESRTLYSNHISFTRNCLSLS